MPIYKFFKSNGYQLTISLIITSITNTLRINHKINTPLFICKQQVFIILRTTSFSLSKERLLHVLLFKKISKEYVFLNHY